MIDLKIKLESMDEADERINLCKRVMTSEMVEQQGELQDVLLVMNIVLYVYLLKIY
jgi:hypothetical protein